MDIPYNYIEANNESELRDKLVKLSFGTGFTFKIINIYKSGNKLVAWYYSSKRT